MTSSRPLIRASTFAASSNRRCDPIGKRARGWARHARHVGPQQKKRADVLGCSPSQSKNPTTPLPPPPYHARWLPRWRAAKPRVIRGLQPAPHCAVARSSSRAPGPRRVLSRRSLQRETSQQSLTTVGGRIRRSCALRTRSVIRHLRPRRRGRRGRRAVREAGVLERNAARRRAAGRQRHDAAGGG